MVAVVVFEPSCPCVFSFTFSFLLSFLLFYPYTMSSSSIHRLSTSEEEFSEPSTSSRPYSASGYELHPRFIAMVRAQTFFGLENEDPEHHLQAFEELCSCLVIPTRHVTGILEVEVVPFLSRGEGGAMVHSQREGYDPRLGRAPR